MAGRFDGPEGQGRAKPPPSVTPGGAVGGGGRASSCRRAGPGVARGKEKNRAKGKLSSCRASSRRFTRDDEIAKK